MKKLTLLLIIISGTVYAQKLKDRIQGDWVCVGIFDSNNNPTNGKFGESNEYLKFSFNKSDLYISEAPFDKGSVLDIAFKGDKIIDVFPGAVYEFPEQFYEVATLNNDYLTLITKGENKEILKYNFLKQKNFEQYIDNGISDQGILIVDHLLLSADRKSINKTFEYRIPNDTAFLSPTPTFEYSKGGYFGQIFSFNIKLPKTFKLDEPTSEMIIDFDVSEDGASNIIVTKGLSSELDLEIVRVIEKFKKSWKPIVLDEKLTKTTLRFHLYFHMTIAKTQLPWEQQ